MTGTLRIFLILALIFMVGVPLVPLDAQAGMFTYKQRLAIGKALRDGHISPEESRALNKSLRETKGEKFRGKGYGKGQKQNSLKSNANRPQVDSSGIDDLLKRHEDMIHEALLKGWISRDEALRLLGQMYEIRVDAMRKMSTRGYLHREERKEYQMQLREQLLILRGRKS